MIPKVSPAKAGRIRYDWWRAHHGLPGHPKWRAVARSAQVPVSAAFHIVVCLLDAASRGQPRGSISEFKAFDCAGIVDVPVDKVDRVVEVLREIHWIEGHMVAEWDGRQPLREDAHVAKRVAEYRSRNPSVTKRDNDTSNASEALHEDMSRNESVTNVDVTPANAPDRDKDNNLSSESSTARASPKKPLVDDKGKEIKATPFLAGSGFDARLAMTSPKKCGRCGVSVVRDLPNRCLDHLCPTMPDYLRWRKGHVPPECGLYPIWPLEEAAE